MSSATSALRWHCKKVARKGLAAGSLVTGALKLAESRSRSPCIRALTYHRFGVAQRDPFCVTPGDFEEQMAYLAEQRLAISLGDLERFLEGRKSLDRNAVLVTIDDGYHSVYSTALPILRDYSIPAVAYVTPSLIPDNRESRNRAGVDASEPYLTWDEVASPAEEGISIGSHAWTHRSLGRMTPEEVEEEAIRSRESLERHLHQSVTSFAYPFGTRADFNHTTASILERTGYTSAFTSQHGAMRSDADPFVLPRVKVEGGEGAWLFRLLTRGGLDAWRFVDHLLWRLQAAR